MRLFVASGHDSISAKPRVNVLNKLKEMILKCKCNNSTLSGTRAEQNFIRTRERSDLMMLRDGVKITISLSKGMPTNSQLDPITKYDQVNKSVHKWHNEIICHLFSRAKTKHPRFKPCSTLKINKLPSIFLYSGNHVSFSGAPQRDNLLSHLIVPLNGTENVFYHISGADVW